MHMRMSTTTLTHKPRTWATVDDDVGTRNARAHTHYTTTLNDDGQLRRSTTAIRVQSSVTALRPCSRAQVYVVTRTHTITYTGQHTVL